MFGFILLIFIIWRVNLEFLAWLGEKVLPVRGGFLGPSPWANFDGIHYLSIANHSYSQFEQAFFPFYPLTIRFLSKILRGNFVLAGMIISNFSLFLALLLFWKLLEIWNIGKIKNIKDIKKWAIIFLLFSPTSFFFGSVYTESLFLVLVLSSFYLFKKRKWLSYIFFASLSSAVRLVGAFLLAPFGLFAYMFYLAKTTGDALFFIHAQPFFGAGRSGGEIILLFQVYWRYFKIFTTASLVKYNYWVALLEFIMFNIVLFLLWLGWKRNLPKTWILFSITAVITPSLTGTLSSMPRYILIAFPIFIVMAGFNKKLKYLLFIASYLLFSLLTILFTRGYWIS